MKKGLRDDAIAKVDKLSFEQAIQLTKDRRDALIRSFFYDEELKSFFLVRYNKELSNIKTQFLQKELKGRLVSPIDLTHYASVIKQLRECSVSSPISISQELFYKELEAVFKKYNY